MTVISGPALDIPPTAAGRVEFISQIHPNPSTELVPLPIRGIDVPYLTRYIGALEDAGFEYTLVPYGSAGADSFVLASAIGQLSGTLKPIVALRPNTTFPLVAAQKLATLDQLTEGRAIVHLISGGSDAEQARQGDYLPKDRRYARTAEFLQLLRRAWTERTPFSFEGEFYKFDDFGPGYPTYSGEALPISIGGQSDAAFDVGGRLADVFCFWGEPVAEVAAQIARVRRIARAAGRDRGPRFWVTFRPIIAPTDELAWRKAYGYVERIGQAFREGSFFPRGFTANAPQNVGSQRALRFAAEREVFDRALWTATAAATGAAGAATALVGSPETVAAAILDYIDIGADLVSIRGYDNLNDTVDYGRFVIPLVRQELAHRAATRCRGGLQAQHPGALAPGFDAAALAGQ
jgi:alkanesulfonate monooxygenase